MLWVSWWMLWGPTRGKVTSMVLVRISKRSFLALINPMNYCETCTTRSDWWLPKYSNIYIYRFVCSSFPRSYTIKNENRDFTTIGVVLYTRSYYVNRFGVEKVACLGPCSWDLCFLAAYILKSDSRHDSEMAAWPNGGFLYFSSVEANKLGGLHSPLGVSDPKQASPWMQHTYIYICIYTYWWTCLWN